MRIGTNISALNAVNRLNKVTAKLAKNSAQLSSGKRIVSAADDAAGLAIAEQIGAIARLERKAQDNIGVGVSAISIAEGTLQTVSDIDIRRAELSQQAANGSLSPSQRESLDAEYQELGAEKDRVLASASFNGTPLFENGGATFSVQVGTSGGANDQISVAISTPSSGGGNLLTQAAAQAALDDSKAQIASTAEASGKLGAFTSRLSVADSNLAVSSLNNAAAESQIRDLDIAQGVTERSGLLIQQQASLAVAAQANQLPASVMRLLRG